MRFKYEYLPFLVAPFLFPDTAPGLRFLALLLLLVEYGWIVRSHLLDGPQGTEESLSILPIWALIGAGSAYFLMDDPWNRSLLYPSIVGGGLIFAVLSQSQVSRLFGFGITAGILGLLYCLRHWLFSESNPSEFSELVSRFFPISPLEIGTGPAFPAAIGQPRGRNASFIILLLRNGVMLLLTWGFAGAYAKRWWLKLLGRVGAIGLCLAFIYIVGNQGFLLLGGIVLLYYFYNQEYEPISATKILLMVIGIVGVAGAGYYGYFNRLWGRLFRPGVVFGFLDPNGLGREYFTGTVGMFLGTYAPQRFPILRTAVNPGFEAAAIAGIALIALLLVFWKKRNEKPTDSGIPAAAAVFWGCSLSAVSTFAAFISHPLSWLSLAAVLRPSRDNGITENRWFSFLSKKKNILTKTWMGVGAILGLSAFYILIIDWQADRALSRFTHAPFEEERFEIIRTAYLRTPYRGDLAAVYATVLASRAAQTNQLPYISQVYELETALHTGGRYGYIPYLSYLRFVNVCFRNQNGDQAVRFLEIAVSTIPNAVEFRELLADSLMKLNRVKDALNQYQECLRVDTTSIRIRNKLKNLYKSLGMTREYQEEISELRKINPILKLD